MIGTLRGKLTAFNTAVTSVILLAMTLLCLFVSERDTRAKTYQNFTSYMSTITAYLSSQEYLSSGWLNQMESAGNVSISICDGGKPLFSMRLSPEDLSEQYSEVRFRARKEYSLYADRVCGGKSCAFTMEDAKGDGYIGGYAVISKGKSVIELMLLYSLEDMEQSILQQRLVVCFGEIIAVILLWAFSWHFTGRMLRPIQENQQRQAQFTAAASHELRTPLAAILSAASAMEHADANQRSFFLGHIQSEGRRMSRLIGDMLTLSSGDSQNWEVHRESTELDMLLLEIYESYLAGAAEKGLALSIQIPNEDIPAIQVDRERIIQVLAVLLDNALFYTPAPGRIMLALEARRRKVRILVSDTGPGVPDSEKEIIFERFHRGEKARSDRGHFGLGLSIAAQIVKLHEGKIWVQNAAIGGAEFVIELPTN